MAHTNTPFWDRAAHIRAVCTRIQIARESVHWSREGEREEEGGGRREREGRREAKGQGGREEKPVNIFCDHLALISIVCGAIHGLDVLAWHLMHVNTMAVKLCNRGPVREGGER